MKKVLFLCIFFALSIFLNFAQDQAVDSLLNLLQKQTLTSQEQFEIYHQLSTKFTNKDRSNALLYAEKGLSLAEKENDSLSVSMFYERFGRIYNMSGSLDTALIYWNKMLDMEIKRGDKIREAMAYLGLGILYNQQNKKETVLEYFIKALNIYEALGNKERCAEVLLNLASIHRGLGNTERCIYYLQQSEEIAEEIKDPYIECRVSYEFGAVYHKNKEYEKALEYSLKTLELSRRIEERSYEMASLDALGLIYCYHFRDYDKAEKYAKEGVDLSREYGNKVRLYAALNALSGVYRAAKRFEDCKNAALEAWMIDSTNIGHAGRTVVYSLIYSNIYLGNKEDAIYYLSKFHEITAQYNDKSFHESLADLEVKYETEKKEMRIVALEKERQLYIWLIVVSSAFLLTFIGILFYQYRLKKQRIKQLEQEKQIIAMQSVLDGETAERSRLARDLHDGLGGMLSVIKLNLNDVQGFSLIDGEGVKRFTKAMEMLDESIGELRRVAHHMMPESLMRYGLKVSIEDFCQAIPIAHFNYLGNDSRLDSRLEVMIYRCTYELVNNAVKYANASKINVQLLVDDSLVALTVYDDGKGFDPETITSGTGLSNICTRVTAYNGKMNIRSAPGEGTEVSIEIEDYSAE